MDFIWSILYFLGDIFASGAFLLALASFLNPIVMLDADQDTADNRMGRFGLITIQSIFVLIGLTLALRFIAG